MAYGTVNADLITTSAAQSLGAGNATNFKNRIINGAMMIDQRNAGASVTPTSGAYTLDRWAYFASQASKFTVQQNAGSVTLPAGFVNYLGATVASAVSIGSGDNFYLEQKVEGLNVADLSWGTASAKTVTLSFLVYSSLTGTFGGAIRNSAENRSYPFNYTISSPNTWTTVSVTIAGDTTGTWLTTNGVGLKVAFSLGMGSTYSAAAGAWAAGNYASATGATSVVGTNGATFYITGVQLEVGSSASSFEVRDYGRELIMCQRYYQVLGNSATNDIVVGAYATAGATIYGQVYYKVNMRAVPTGTLVGTWYTSNCGQPTIQGPGSSGCALGIAATGTGALVTASNTSAYLTMSAEL